jgi:glutathione synthase/RimK-type ligase-like ATP-grasp enzyme
LIKNHSNTAIFNEQFLDKIAVFKALAKDESVKAYMPESLTAASPTTLNHMIVKYAVCFIKPASGSMGRGIIRVQREPSGAYVALTSHLNGTSRQSFKDSKQLLRFLTAKIRRKPHLIQQGLSLLKINRQNLDYRALVQKDRNGKWGLTSIVARIAGPRHFVSNVARGGRLTSVPHSLRRARIGKQRAQALVQELRKSALLVAAALDRHWIVNLVNSVWTWLLTVICVSGCLK